MLLDYYLLDVFTDTQMAGNPLAVVMKADRLSSEIMQKIAREFALSETVFLSAPKGGRNTAGARIFTPSTELPFAGHPTIGAAVLIGLTQRASAIRLEEKIGVITCIMDRVSKKVGEAFFKIPKLSAPTKAASDVEAIAQTLGLPPDLIGYDDYQPCCYSAGLEFILVPVKDRAALADIILQRRGWADTYGSDHASVYAFTGNTGRHGIDFSARMFDPGLPKSEDPATGSAVAALIGLVAQHTPEATGQHNYVVEQGVDMGRPSLIKMQVGKSEGKLVHGGIGGKAVLVGQGTLDLDWHETL